MAEKDSPSALPARSWRAVLRRTVKEFLDDELSDRAAALTYYGVLSLFPALLLLVSLLGVVGKSATDTILGNIGNLAPGPARDILRNAVVRLSDTGGTGSVLAVLGLLAALSFASGYVAAFIRTSNAVYDLPEGRPVWKPAPLRLLLTVALMPMLAAGALIVVFTGPLAKWAGTAIGPGNAAITLWDIAE